MSAADLLERLDNRGVRVSLDGADLRLRGPAKVLTSDLTDEIRLVKSEMIHLLLADSESLESPPPEDGDQNHLAIASYLEKAVQIQIWLTDHVVEHLALEPSSSAQWMSTVVEFDIIERHILRESLRFDGCIHADGICPSTAQVACTYCFESGKWREF
ncbi:MAG: hypothetical protein HQ478_14575 [Chloroflexi bacterium]|nr:hypothetical protein [Chloroflexota bacterium]